MLSHHHHNMEHSIKNQSMLVVYVPMNNTFSLCPQVSDTVLSQYSPLIV